MKRMTYFVMALALVLGFTQCKKEQVNTPENETKTVNITLNVGGNGGGSRHDINTTTGAVSFQNGDVIYVGNGSTYIGTLTRTDDGVFSGPINEPVDGTKIYFFFVGGLTTTPTDLSGQSSFTVDISNQSTQMPVLSCNHVTYSSGTTSYSCVLQNQCALVKFTTASTTAAVRVGGLYTKAQIDFASNSITHTDTKGFVNLYPDADDDMVKWAVLLPQTGFNAEAAVAHVGYAATIPTIEADDFITGDAAISISTPNNIIYLNWLTSAFTAQKGNILTGTLGGYYSISIADGATVTLNGVTINQTGTFGVPNLPGIDCQGDVTIILADGTTNTVRPMRDRNPAIYIASGKTLTIKGGELGTGSLTAGSTNQYSAGIGSCSTSGGFSGSCGNIVIEGGIITAQGGYYCAGIGAANTNGCGNITITGGTVTATGGSRASGIGAGSGSSCGTITIENTVTQVTATRGASGINSIGRGYGSNSNCGTVTIGGTVYWDGSAYQNGGDTYLPTSPLVYPAPTPAEATVTWINYHIQQIFLENGQGEIYQGVGVQLDDDLEASYWDGTDVYLYEMGMLTFQIDTDGAYAEYDIKKIEIYYSYFSGNLPEGGGWSNDGSKLTWDDGLTPSVILQNQGPDPDMSIEVTEVVFTLQKSTK